MAGARGGDESSIRSLAARYPKRWDVPILIVVSTGLLIAGLSLPVMHTTKLVFWKDEYSIWSGIRALFEESHYGLGVLLLFFSVVFPFAKLAALGGIWFVPVKAGWRKRTLFWLKVLGKWSMLDVFVIAIIVVISQMGGLLEAEARIGVYIFGAAIIGSMMASFMVDHLAGKSGDGG